MNRMPKGTWCQAYFDDIRDMMTDEDRKIFETLYFDAPDHKVMFEFRKGTDILFEAMRLWKHTLSGVLYTEWRETVKQRENAFLESHGVLTKDGR